MKKYIYLFLTLSLAFMLQGCRKKHIGPDNGYVWYEVTKHGLHGAYDENGKELLPCIFQSITLDDDWKDGNSSYDYLWQLSWDVVDISGDSLEIRLYEFEGDWRYYRIFHYPTRTVAISVQDYENEILPYANHDPYPLCYKKACPSMKKLHFFMDYNFTSGYSGIYKDDGTPVIPIERRYFNIRPVEQDGKVWYMFMAEHGYRGVCDAYGNEIFRYHYKDCVNWHSFSPEDAKKFHKYTWCDEYLTYDSKKGFGSVQVRRIVDEYGSTTFDYYIRYTGITIGDYSTSFDVEPSGNNDTAAIINLKELSIDLLYKGKYVFEDGYNHTTGQMYPNFQRTETILIYEDSLSGGIHAKFEGMSYGKRVYVAKPYTSTQYGMYSNSTIITTKYYVSSTYDIQENQTWSSNWSTMYITSNLIKEGTDYCPANGNYGNITICPSPTPPTPKPTPSPNPELDKQWRIEKKIEDCPICHRSGKCSTCNGKHWYYSTFGRNKIICPNCTDGKCKHCHGTGTVIKYVRVYK